MNLFEYWQHRMILQTPRKMSLVRLVLRKKGQYKQDGILIRDLRFTANNKGGKK